MKKQKGISSLLVIAIAAGVVMLILAGVFAYYFFSGWLKNKPSTQQPDNQNKGILLSEAEPNFAKTFQINQDDYAFLVSVGTCEHSTPGNAPCKPIKNKIDIKDVKTSQLIQEINLRDIDSDFYSYDKYPNVAYEDLNFDGEKDLAITYSQNAPNLSYYDVYLYNKNTKKFELSKNFSDAISGHLNFYATNYGTQNVIRISDKNSEIRYEIINNVPKKVYQKIEEDSGSFTKRTEGRLINNTWSETVSAESNDGKAYEIYTNKAYNFQTLIPFETFYIKGTDKYKDTSIIETNYDNPKLDSTEGGAYIYLENYGSDYPDRTAEWFRKSLDNPSSPPDLKQNITGPEKIKNNQYSYGYIYKVTYNDSIGYQDIYFFPNFGLVFNYKSLQVKQAYKEIEDDMVKFATPTKTLLAAKDPIIVTSPKGGENLRVGETHNIIWKAENTSDLAIVQITLVFNHSYNLNSPYGPESCIMDSAHPAKNTGTYSWTIPSECEGVKLGGDNQYYITVFVKDWATGKLFSDDSGYFTIAPQN
ncbi:MAG: hypothetical protein AAB529_01920 [Patescibacteria group bacterium]